jgi:predicted AlkP superfamily pyrophosphatase or phosphodiesterase
LTSAVDPTTLPGVNKVAVLNAVGLTPSLISATGTPRLAAFRDAGKMAAVGPVLPAVTTTVQATYLTGQWPSDHGIVGNGWYDRHQAEVQFWKQADGLVQRPRIWELAKKINPACTTANVCWWYAMYSGADYTVTPRPMYPADGRKLPDCWTNPPELRDELQAELGQFPLFKFWGPMTDVSATRWIADAAIRIDQKVDPTLSLVYLPHLDYALQRRGPDDPANRVDLGELDAICGTLIDHFHGRGAKVIVLSEYGIAPVDRPVHLNRALREAGLLAIRVEQGRELLDAGASAAFAVADHQVAHVYVNDRAREPEVRAVLEGMPGVGRVLDGAGKQTRHLDHPRAGTLVALAEPGAWFTYYYWEDDAAAPDFARTVDIHRKPGYDPVELFLDPAMRAPKAQVGAKLLKRKLGFRGLLDVIPLDATLVKGSHGLPPASAEVGPLVMSDAPDLIKSDKVDATAVCELILSHLAAKA